MGADGAQPIQDRNAHLRLLHRRKYAVEIGNRPLQALTQLRFGLPVELVLCQRDIRFALPWIVLRQGEMPHLAGGSGQLHNQLGKLGDRELGRVAEVEWPGQLGGAVHEAHETRRSGRRRSRTSASASPRRRW